MYRVVNLRQIKTTFEEKLQGSYRKCKSFLVVCVYGVVLSALQGIKSTDQPVVWKPWEISLYQI